MKSKWVLIFLGAVYLLAVASTSALADGTGKCGGADIANGPFGYSALGVTQATFNGQGGLPVSTNFSITAPSVDSKQQTDLPDIFPGEGQSSCTATAFATISALEIQKVGDADGNPIDPVDINLSSNLGQLISGAFSFTPSTNTFDVGGTVNVTVVINNPNVDLADYGDYDIKLAAQAPGYGIGVGNGPHFLLSLRDPSATDRTPPVVTVTKPAGDEILGVIPVEIQAYDPDTPPPGTGLISMSATVSSAGGAVSNLDIPLTIVPSLPVAAGVTVTATGNFSPTGGTGTAGTTDASAFDGSSRSGIGSYIINAQATDGAGNTGLGSKSFNVNYDVAFTTASSPNPNCENGGNGNCGGQFKFTVKRSNITSDGAFMYDKTVVVKLVRKSDNTVMATHAWGTGSILNQVQIDTTPIYQTNFKRSDLTGPPSGPGTYKAEVYFLDVDGNLMLQGTSNDVTF
jgi:hypothetical protein